MDLVFLPGANSTGAISLKAIGALAALSTNNSKENLIIFWKFWEISFFRKSIERC